MSRVNNTLKNIAASTGGELFVLLLRFITRTVLIKTLGAQYLGVNGLFSNIISLLSLAELGIGTAIVYNLYQPISNNDQHQILLLMNIYRRAYRIIGFSIAAMGLCLMPFLPYIIKGDTSFINIYLLFFLFLMQSVSSYLFFAYKSALVKAYQKEYIISIIGYIFIFATNIVQIIFLLFIPDFTLYIVIGLIFTILQNLACAIKTDKMFPFIKEKTKSILPKNEQKEIFKNCGAIFLYNINGVVVKATDNIVLASFMGLTIVGIYSNYILIYAMIKSILFKMFNAMLASLGNLHASKDVEHELFIFKVTNFIAFGVFGVAAIGIFTAIDEFITIWIGKEYILLQPFSLLIAIEIYLEGIQKNIGMYRNSMGLFQQAKYRPIFGTIINLSLSIILVQYMGINGVIIGTLIAHLCTFVWFDPLIIYQYVFKRSVKSYYITNIKYVVVVLIAGELSYIVSKLTVGDGWFFVITHIIESIIVSLFTFYLFFGRTKEFKYLLKIAIKIFKNMLGRRK